MVGKTHELLGVLIKDRHLISNLVEMAGFKSLKILSQILNRRLLIFPNFRLISQLLITDHFFDLGIGPGRLDPRFAPGALDSHGLDTPLLRCILKFLTWTIRKVKNFAIIFLNFCFILSFRNVHHWFRVVEIPFVDRSHSFEGSNRKWIFLFQAHARHIKNRQLASAWFWILERKGLIALGWPNLTHVILVKGRLYRRHIFDTIIITWIYQTRHLVFKIHQINPRAPSNGISRNIWLWPLKVRPWVRPGPQIFLKFLSVQTFL